MLAVDRLAEDAEIRNLVGGLGAALTPLPAAFFDSGHAEERLAKLFGVKTMELFGHFSRAELSAAAALIAYIDKTQIAKRPPIEPPRRLSDSDAMRIDAATRANLELFRSTSGSRNGTLLSAIDRTRSAAGSRLLAEQLASPSPIRRGLTSALMLFSFSSSGPCCELPSGLRSTGFRTCCARSRGLGSTVAGHATST